MPPLPSPSCWVDRLERRRLLAAVPFVEVAPGPASADPDALVVFDGILYFAADDGQHGRELWRTDGTPAGTRMVKDVRPGPEGSAPGSFAVHAGRLYFAADDGEHGPELWSTDGTEAGTALVSDALDGPDGLAPHRLVSSGGLLYFTAFAPSQLWVTDGTDAGTRLLAEGLIGELADLDGTLIFRAYVPGEPGAGLGIELWRSDGTPETTTMVRDINGGQDSSHPTGFTRVGDHLYFYATEPSDGGELWRTDGTPTGTVQAADVRAGGTGSDPHSLVAADGKLYFSALTGFGRELWRFDPAGGGAQRLTDLLPGAGSPKVQGLAAFGDKVLFWAEAGSTWFDFWCYDPATNVATMLSDVSLPVGPPWSGVTLGSNFYSLADDGTGTQVYRTDGTPAGTQRITGIGTEAAKLSSPSQLTVFGDSLVFAATDAARGRELWIIRPPVAHPGGPYVATTWPLTTLDGSASADPDPAESLTYAWDLDEDGLFGETGPAATRGDEVGVAPAFNASGDPAWRSFAVSLRVTNAAGLSHVASTTVTFAAPAVLPIAPRTIGVGSAMTASGSFVDDPGATSWTATVDYGDGAGPQPLAIDPAERTFSLAHVYAAARACDVTVTVTNDLGGAGVGTFRATVRGPSLVGTFQNKAMGIRFDPEAGLVHFYDDVPLAGEPSFSIREELATTITVDTPAGNDSLTIVATAGEDVIDLDPGRVLVNAVRIDLLDVENVSVEAGDGDDRLALSGGLPYKPTFNLGAGGNALSVTGGATATLGPAAPGEGPLAVEVSGAPSTLIVSASRDLASLSLADGGRLWLSSQSPIVVRSRALSIGAGSTLDVGSHDLVVQSDEAHRDEVLAQVRAWAAAGMAAPGIFSSTELRGRLPTGLAVILNQDDAGEPLFGAFGPFEVDASSVLVKYTYDGDADLSGRIDAADYHRIDRGRALGLAGYRNGDFDLSGGAPDINDYLLIDAAFLKQTTLLAATVGSASADRLFRAAAPPMTGPLKRTQPFPSFSGSTTTTDDDLFA